MQFDLTFFLGFVFHPPASLLFGLWITVASTVLAMAMGVFLGVLLAIAGLGRSRLLRSFNQVYIAFFRGTPILVQLMLIYFGLPYLMGGFDLFPPVISLGPLVLNGAMVAGIVAFGLHEAAYMSEITRAGISSIDPGQAEAAKSLGMARALTMRKVILPQAVRVIIPPLGNQFNAMFKTTSLLSVIAVPEMFHIADAIHAATYRTFEVYLGVSVYYLVLTGIWTVLQRRLEAHLKTEFVATPARRAKPKRRAPSPGRAGWSAHPRE
ncbi:MAG: amino acid ABC transporter permease [Proteobacteria bacterium]|nr:amino acid ABC transporter permease [Pseudomonadota bacterium]MBI3497615.1 amino acid ABC transporter permease [Pseudomonadota bacterium]